MILWRPRKTSTVKRSHYTTIMDRKNTSIIHKPWLFLLLSETMMQEVMTINTKSTNTKAATTAPMMTSEEQNIV